MSALEPVTESSQTPLGIRKVPTGDIRNERGRQLRRPRHLLLRIVTLAPDCCNTIRFQSFSNRLSVRLPCTQRRFSSLLRPHGRRGILRRYRAQDRRKRRARGPAFRDVTVPAIASAMMDRVQAVVCLAETREWTP